MKMKMHGIQFAVIVNWIQMKLMKRDIEDAIAIESVSVYRS
jgi:hypothetical protein